MLSYTLKVVEIRKETIDTVTVCFKQPALKKVKYQAGQYLTLIFRINGRRYVRPYSFSSAFGIDQHIEVTVKRIIGGVVSNHINDKLAVGDMVEVMEPLGDFTLDAIDNLPQKHVVLWGAGSGITPLISIAKFALHHNACEHVTLVYGNRTEETTIFTDLIEALKLKFANFSAFNFYSKLVISSTNSKVIEGRIDPEKVLTVMQQEGRVTDTVHFICGPVGLKESVRKQLDKIGVTAADIYTEDFEIIKDPKEFEDITTQNVELSFKGEVNNVEVVKGQSILEGGLNALLELPYSCQTGNCKVCLGKIISGQIKMPDVPKKKELLADECLLCCSYPLSANVKISIAN